MAIGSSPAKLVVRGGWRFSLRALLILLLVAALPLAWVSHWRSRKLREHAAAKRLRQLGAEVKMRRPDLSPRQKAADESWSAMLLPPEHTNQVIWVRVPFDRPLDAQGIRLLLDLPNLIRLDLNGQSAAPDVSLAPLRSLPQLEILGLRCLAKDLPHFANQRKLCELYLTGDGITDDCGQMLQNNPRLISVSFLGTSTSDALTPHLARLEHLEFLQLVDTKISSACMLHLSQLQTLKQLVLIGNEIDDAAIPAIKQLKSLRYLSLHKTRISEDGLEQLRAALPNCRID